MKDLINERSSHRLLYQRSEYQQLMSIELAIIHFNDFIYLFIFLILIITL